MKVSPAVLSVPGVKEMTSQKVQPKGIKNVKFSMFTMSVTVDYDPSILDAALIDELLTTTDETRGKEVAEQLQQALGLDLV